METRELGNSGLTVGVVGLGCEGLLDKAPDYYAKALDLMEGAGANCIDLYSPSPDLRTNLGRAMRGRREKFILQGICAPSGKTGSTNARATCKRCGRRLMTSLKGSARTGSTSA
ncbi:MULTISPECIES: hypothetical protein [unclassified Desulfovibrio]|uniref:hypothetical protein n=1 Tax=unclassified Desulfovibrio TaxID=2593640 RepID=UPI00197D00D1|nr:MULTISPECIES: hypothetical protein [unclassified Desulfovibrio]